jgi:hypothetical protein
LTFATFAGLLIVVSLPRPPAQPFQFYNFTKLYTSQLGWLAAHKFLEEFGNLEMAFDN